MKPFLNWAGGKRWLVASHPELVQLTDRERLIEPFLGSGAVFFHVGPSKALLSDANVDLVDAFTAVRDDAAGVLLRLQQYKDLHSRENYYLVRDGDKPRHSAARAARFIYLNRTCFNGLYRVNLKGEFNVPMGSKATVVLPDDDFAAWAVALTGAELVAQDFELTVAEAGEGDVLYVDPPYTVQHNNNNFVKYNEHIFSWADQVRLADALHAASGRGARIFVSNADHPSVRALYESPIWTPISLARASRLAASSDHRRMTTELVISNCVSDGNGRGGTSPAADSSRRNHVATNGSGATQTERIARGRTGVRGGVS